MITRRIGLSCIALGLAACSQSYEVFTCAFGAGQTSCTPVLASERPTSVFDAIFSVINPNAPSAPCAGDFHLSVNAEKGGYMTWDAQERDATTCAPVGAEMSGERALDGQEHGVDAHYEQGNFTFRCVVRPEG